MKKSFYAQEFLLSSTRIPKKNIYLIVGDEQYFIDRVIKKLKLKFKVDEDDFDFVLLYGGETKASDLIFELRQIPLTSHYHFVILKEFKKYSTKDKEAIANYSQKPFKKSVLVLVTDDFDKRLKSSKLLLEHSVEIICKKPYAGSDILKWLRSKEIQNKIAFEPDARLYFSENVALDYLTAQNELEKIILYKGTNKGKITLEDVKESLGLSKKESIFSLLESIGQKNIKQSIKTLHNLLDNGESPIMIISMLTNYFKTLWIIRVSLDKQYKIAQIKKNYMSGIYYKFQDRYISASKRYNIKAIKNIFKCLLETDKKLKSIDVEEKLLMDLLIINILEK